MPWWYGPWDGSWFIFPLVFCAIMMIGMMLMMGRGHMGGMGHTTEMRHWDGGWSNDEQHIDPALETLRERFAKGELSKEEYEDQRKTLLTV